MSVLAPSVDESALAEVEEFGRQVEKFIAGELTKDQFKTVRLGFGLYSLRKPGYFLIRTKIAGGKLSARGLYAVADASEKFGDGFAHLTTRQDIQIYFIKLENLEEALKTLYSAGITSLNAGGNTLRNMIISSSDHIDVVEAARSISSHFMRSPYSKGLPRKIKVTLTGGLHDTVGVLTDDIGLIALGPKEGYEKFGFRVYVGGGQGALPKLGHMLEDFVPAENINRVILSVLTLFNKHGQRVNRHKARLKFYIEGIGMEAFKAQYRAEYEKHANVEPIAVPLAYVPAENVAQTVHAKASTGDLTPTQLRRLAALIEENAGVSAIVTKNGTLKFTGVAENIRSAFTQTLVSLGLSIYDPAKTARLLACNGSTTCSEGITNSKGLAKRLELIAERYEKAGLSDFTLAVSGCPNACSRHHTADIGLSGSAKKVNGKLAPHYQLYVGGVSAGANPAFGRPVIKIPAKNATLAVDHILAEVLKARQAGDSFSAALGRIGVENLEAALVKFTSLPSFEEVLPSEYYDWDTETEFSLDEVGPGECAGSALEIIDGLFDEARRHLSAAKGAVASQESNQALQFAHEAAISAAKALLVTYGIDPSTEEETYREFNTKIVTRGFVPERYKTVLTTSDQKKADLASIMATHEAFVEDCLAAYSNINADSNEEGKRAGKKVSGHKRLDLTGVKCPYNYIKVKLALEDSEPGEKLEVILDDGAPIRNVPQSLLNDGHTILVKEPFEGSRHLLLVEKG